jgi:hypothetical protein
MYPMVIEYPKSPSNSTNGNKIYQYFPIYGPPKFTQIGIFGLKINHLATLSSEETRIAINKDSGKKAA